MQEIWGGGLNIFSGAETSTKEWFPNYLCISSRASEFWTLNLELLNVVFKGGRSQKHAKNVKR